MNVRPKPENSKWTDEQWQAIDGDGNNILVSAAAGSGKTAVLVERIIRKLMDEENPIDVDRLLIVTFTNAAAAEMRARIGTAIESQLKEYSSSLHLRRQLSLLNRAHISTLHSFCMHVVRQHYYEVEVDPHFRIVDDAEGELIREEVLEEVFETEYSKEDNEEFFTIVDQYGGEKGDDALRLLVRKLYDFSRSHPHPQTWLEQVANRYKLPAHANLNELEWTIELMEDVKNQLSQCKQMIEQAEVLTKEPDGPYPYATNFEEDQKLIDQLQTANDWEEMYERFSTLSFTKLKSIKKSDAVNEDLKERAKAIRDRVKKQIQKLKEMFVRDPDKLIDDIHAMQPAVNTLVYLVHAFRSRYDEVKKEKAVVDFSDLEHLCLTILSNRKTETGEFQPSEVAQEYKHLFHEVFVDEYQDTNLVQETIIQLISSSNNCFMVGDVKQSIYRFRLAEPSLFLEKYERYDQGKEGWRIDLSANFRSRWQVLNGVNYLFRQLMDDKVGSLTYDERAELKVGRTDFPEQNGLETELAVINKGDPVTRRSHSESDLVEEWEEELENAQMEARYIAKRIKSLIHTRYKVFDKDIGEMRPVTYRDVVILMRSMPWASTMMEEFKKEGIPVYAELTTGYFDAVEIQVMMSLLQVIDNPHQDIALAAVLRSPIVGLDEDQLATIRLADRKGSFFDALQATTECSDDPIIQKEASAFCQQLQLWRSKARSGDLSELIWSIYRTTKYYDFVGGIPGGKQRQANLRALYDRARSYESTSFRGLFRFLRFIERMRERGEDLGAARALGEQEDVVRFMTIHKSKGLEFPIVFLAGLNKPFNQQDERSHTLLHKELGFGTKYIDPHYRLMYATLPYMAIKRRIKKENIEEEMRVLYVALTRAEEKLILVGTVNDAAKSLQSWEQVCMVSGWTLPDIDRAQARTFLDWVAPAIIRHQDAKSLIGKEQTEGDPMVEKDPSTWDVRFVEKADLMMKDREDEAIQNKRLEALQNVEPLHEFPSSSLEQIHRRLSWTYPYEEATYQPSKQTVSDLKQQIQDEYSSQMTKYTFRSDDAKRPAFMQKEKMSAAEKGTAMHSVMQHIPLRDDLDAEKIQSFTLKLVENEILTKEQAEVVDAKAISSFLRSSLGQRLSSSVRVQREFPFHYSVPMSLREGYDEKKEKDIVLIQGVADCVFTENDGTTVLIDYKTDRTTGYTGGLEEALQTIQKRYETQISLYCQALSEIWKRPIHEAYLYLFDGEYIVNMQSNIPWKEGE